MWIPKCGISTNPSNFPDLDDAGNAMVPDATRLAHLTPTQRAEFAVTSRLFSCLVTESLLRALYFPLPDASAKGFALILFHDPSVASAADITQISDVFALVPLQGTPILADCKDGLTIREITLLDPLDMVPLPLVIAKYDQLHSHRISDSLVFTTAILDTLNVCGWFAQDKIQLEVCWDTLFFWRSYARYANLASDLTEEVANELASSVKWQGAYISQRFTPISREEQHIHIKIRQRRLHLNLQALSGSNLLSRAIISIQFVLVQQGANNLLTIQRCTRCATFCLLYLTTHRGHTT